MAYNLLDLRTRVRRKLKDNSYNSSDIDMFLNDAQNEIAGLYLWQWLEKVVSGSLTEDEYTFEQQDDHQITNGLVLIDPDDTDKIYRLSKGYLPQSKFFSIYPVPERYDSGLPYHWTEYGDQIYFERPVDKDYTVRQFYNRLPTDMVADADAPDFPVDFREALVLGATYRAEEQRDNYDFAQIVQNKFNDKVSDLIDRYAMRQLMTTEYSTLGQPISITPVEE